MANTSLKPVSVTFRGQRTLERNLAKYAKAFVSARMGQLQLRAAQGLRDDIRHEAPISESGSWSKKYPSKPGELRESIEAHRYRDRAGKPQAAFVTVNTSKLVFPIKPLWVIYGVHGHAGNDFFRRGIQIGKAEVKFIMVAGIKEISRDAEAGFTQLVE